MYRKYVKRFLDIICALAAMGFFWWLFAIIAVLVRVKLGTPVIFTQHRPGMIDPKTGKERIFKLCKFRTMTDQRDEVGNLMPDSVRLTSFGAKLRELSLDELPEAWNILKGDMSVIGPRPQLVRDMVFMTEEQRKRHTVRPGLSGLAQVRGRNAINWEDRLASDLEYIQQITFWNDVKIVFMTVAKVFKREGISEEGSATSTDLGDYLLEKGEVGLETYQAKQTEAKDIFAECMRR